MIESGGGDEGCHIAFELKATSDWDPKGTNRIVLTSSSKKLRDPKFFSPPICHLLCTAQYDRTSAVVNWLRLDFLEPTTEVNVRFEASVNHKILAAGSHQKITI